MSALYIHRIIEVVNYENIDVCNLILLRLLSTDPAAAKEVVLADKPLISEETDLLEPTLLDELICHISSLASVYHKPPTAFVEGRSAGNKNVDNLSHKQIII